jgi:hypothetical protein
MILEFSTLQPGHPWEKEVKRMAKTHHESSTLDSESNVVLEDGCSSTKEL